MTDAPVDRELMSEVSRLVDRHLGLHFPEKRFADLARRLDAASVELGFDDLTSCRRWLANGELSSRQIGTLASHLTVGESYFFRDPESFSTLEREVLPCLVAGRAAGTRTMRLWSAGCSTGEEAYSLGIACRRAIPFLDSWSVSILATDINPRFLAQAKRGVYTAWSFRGTPARVRERYFRPVSGKRFAVRPSIKALVHVARLNLASDAYPSRHNATNGMDVILCRNVLMYLSPDRQRRVVSGLHRCLVEGGYLLVSAAEARAGLFPMFEQVDAGGIILFRKPARPIRGHPVPPFAVPPVSIVAVAGDGTLPHRPSVAAEPLPSAGRPASDEVDPLALADAGRLDEALTACQQAIAADRTAIGAHVLSAAICRELGRLDEAVAAFNRVLFLDQDFVLAHFALGDLYRRLGRARSAARHLGVARELLASRGKQELVPGSGGMTCGRLLESVHSALGG